MSMVDNTVVDLAITSTIVQMPDHWQTVMNMRTDGKQVGSFFPDMSVIQLEQALLCADWELVNHPEVASPVMAYKSDLVGMNGMCDLENLHRLSIVELWDRKNCGFYSVEVPYYDGKTNAATDRQRALISKESDHPLLREVETYILIGPHTLDDGTTTNVVYTVHPGEPVSPSQVDEFAICKRHLFDSVHVFCKIDMDSPADHAGAVFYVTRQTAQTLGFDLYKRRNDAS